MKNLLLYALIFCLIGFFPMPAEGYSNPEKVRKNGRQSVVRIRAWKDATLLTKSSTVTKNRIKESVGTGSIVKQTRYETFILTAAHICTLSDFGDKRRAFGEYNPTLHEIEVESLIGVTDVDGNHYAGLVYTFSANYDVCIIISHKIKKPIIKMARRPARLGERVYSFGYPTNTWDLGVVPIFEGFYSGESTNVGGFKRAIYTVPTTFGSSGSPVINGHGRLIGLAHRKARGFESYNMCATHKQLKKFFAFSNSVYDRKKMKVKLKKLEEVDIDALVEDRLDYSLMLGKPPEPDLTPFLKFLF